MNVTHWRIVLLGLLLAAGGAQANDLWSSLWRTPDQRGEQLLRKGDAAAAARTFANPERKAYAELKAGDYAAAARDYAAFDSSDAQYNRGNALAHAGDLQAALKAYDAALKRDPDNRDARHNRELVAEALKQSKPPASSSQNQNPKQDSGKGSENESNKSKGSNKDAGKDQDSGKNAGASGQSSGDKQSGKPGQPQQAGKSGKSSSQPGEQAQSGEPTPSKNPAINSKPQSNPTVGNDAEQARRDAEAGLGKQANQQANAQTGPGELGRAGEAPHSANANAQHSEQQLAQDQWLRQIPDDPGGLLQRKFMIEHLMRQQGNPP
jgi:Ca-activated chloride channel family protein